MSHVSVDIPKARDNQPYRVSERGNSHRRAAAPCGAFTHLTQQEELVGTFLGVFITGALHLLQVYPIQLELLGGRKCGATGYFSGLFIYITL